MSDICEVQAEYVERPVLLDTKAAAEYLSLAVPTLNTWRYLKRGPTFIRIGRLIRYRATDLNAWIESQTSGGDA